MTLELVIEIEEDEVETERRPDLAAVLANVMSNRPIVRRKEKYNRTLRSDNRSAQ